jgi:hypothetical protein
MRPRCSPQEATIILQSLQDTASRLEAKHIETQNLQRKVDLLQADFRINKDAYKTIHVEHLPDLEKQLDRMKFSSDWRIRLVLPRLIRKYTKLTKPVRPEVASFT